jgi:hypothetical protein
MLEFPHFSGRSWKKIIDYRQKNGNNNKMRECHENFTTL